MRLGLVTNLLNPKSALFYSSVFAAVLPVEAPVNIQAAVVLLVLFNAVLWHSFLAKALSNERAKAFYVRQQRGLNRFAALCFGLFGARLLVQGVKEWPAQ